MCTQKIGLKIPKYVAEAKAFDVDNCNTLWWYATYKETNNFFPEFEIWEGDTPELPHGYHKITCHMIFDMNTGETLRRKYRFLADVHNTKNPAAMAY